MKEIYKNLGFLGFPNYEVSNLGNVKKTGENTILEQGINKDGYPCVLLYKPSNNPIKGNSYYTYKIEELVAEAFPDKPNSEEDKEEHKENISAVKIIALILSSLFNLFLIIVTIIFCLVIIFCAVTILGKYYLPIFMIITLTIYSIERSEE